MDIYGADGKYWGRLGVDICNTCQCRFHEGQLYAVAALGAGRSCKLCTEGESGAGWRNWLRKKGEIGTFKLADVTYKDKPPVGFFV